MNPHNLAVGQKLWFVETDHMGRARGGSWREVTKVGREWAQLGDHLRIHLETLKTGTFDDRAYLSKEACDAENLVEHSWRTLARALNSKFHAPEGVTIEDMAEAARLLRLPLEVHRG